MYSKLNVFAGPDALRDFHRPDKNIPLPLVELPTHPFSSHNVRIFAKMLTLTPSANVKSLPALNMTLRAQEAGEFNPTTDKIVECSSGNTVLSLAILNNLYGSPNKTPAAYISNKTSLQKLQLLRFFGLEVKLFGGPAQVEPSDILGGIHAAIQDGKKPGHWNPGQYSNPANSEAHIRWTGPQLFEQIPNIGVFAAAIGTSGTLEERYSRRVPVKAHPRQGTMTGTGSFLKTVKPEIVNLGVFTAPGDRVPGPRPIDLIQAVDLPWKEVIDTEEHVTSSDAYMHSLELCRQGLLCGPSSGLALKGLYQYLAKMVSEGRLDELRAADGDVHCAFICCDLPFLYISDYFSKLPPASFPAVQRPELLDVDLYPYGIDWKIDVGKASALMRKLESVVLDLRDRGDYAAGHIGRSIHFDLQASKEPNPFLDPATLVRQWTVLNARLTSKDATYAQLYSSGVSDVVIVSYDGASAAIAASVLRHNGLRAHYVEGVFDLQAWEKAGVEIVYRDEKTFFRRWLGMGF